MATEETKLRVDQACQAAESFAKLYYETFDKRRQLISKLYSPEARLVWNGNAKLGPDQITPFHDQLPSTEHTIESIDSQPIGEYVTGQNSILVTLYGSVKFQGNKLKSFNQTFVLMAETKEDKSVSWKIVSDCFRLQETN